MATRGGAAPFRSSDGLSTRQVGTSDEIQLRIDPMHADLDNEIMGLRSQVKKLKNVSFVYSNQIFMSQAASLVAQEIHSEAKYQNEFVNQLVKHCCYIPTFECYANDSYPSSSQCEKQHEEIKQEDGPEWLKPYTSCGSLCSVLPLLGLLLVQIFSVILKALRNLCARKLFRNLERRRNFKTPIAVSSTGVADINLS
ncbi:hypothetical protein Cgig2_029829 [Carnegiea gigantea]|uniref:Uncharacterized protein n=1 Tax=Carnegiea gigantea TaxID=171969 RepID=A0A9Q1GWZ5_9CARY|nr:hypothetical protein Cgig2_029829 [Carnegiea gigantea]